MANKRIKKKWEKPKYFINDNVVIPKWVRKMSKEEKDAMIAKLEAEARREKERILGQAKSA